MTLAHESGHGCHDILAYPQGILQFHPPLTLAETASIFGEMIVFRDLLDKAPGKQAKGSSRPSEGYVHPRLGRRSFRDLLLTLLACFDAMLQERLAMLVGKIDDIINSVNRQCSFDRFEELAHTARVDGELAPADLNKLWLQVVDEYYGPAGEVYDNYDNISRLWAYVPHFHRCAPLRAHSCVYHLRLNPSVCAGMPVVASVYNVYNPSGPDGCLCDQTCDIV
eukprot:128472-Prorocentrum_minimum.AAC.2